MKHALLALAVILAAVVAVAADDAAAAKRRLRSVTKTDSAAQSGDVGVAGAEITAGADPFAFENVGRLRQLTQVTITLTIEDGDTGPGESDEGAWFLALDGVDTGIALDGFRGDQTDTRTISGAPANAERILAALKEDGRLAATIITRGAAGTLSVPAGFEATLALEGKQEVRVERR